MAAVDNLLEELKAQIPGATEDGIKLELFSVIGDVCAEALRTAAPTDPTTAPSGWLTNTQYQTNYQTLLHGVLARMFAKAGMPWFSADVAGVHYKLYERALDKSREDAAGSPATLYARIISAVRAQIPEIRDTAITLALFGVADKVRVDALKLVGLTAGNTDPEAWIPADKWDECYLALLEGTLAQLYAQTGKPWASLEMATARSAAFTRELDTVRADTAAPKRSSTFERILSEATIHLPGALDETMKRELYSVAREFLNTTNLWREVIDVPVVTNDNSYVLAPTAEAVRLIELVDGNGLPVQGTMAEPATLILRHTPAAAGTYKATVALVCNAVDGNALPTMPAWIALKYMDVLVDGLLSRMMAHPRKAYSDAQLAVYHGRRYRNAMAIARVEARHQNLYGAQSWQFPKGWAN